MKTIEQVKQEIEKLQSEEKLLSMPITNYGILEILKDRLGIKEERK